MADQYPQYIPERLLQKAVEKRVSEALGAICRELGEFTNDMTEADAMSAKLMILEMVKNAGGEFITKMKRRVERNEPLNVDNGRRIVPSTHRS